MSEQLPEWERLLRAAARLQGILPDATLVGGTAAAIDAGHRGSMDADHVVAGLMDRFDQVLGELESAAGWKTARVKRPVAIYGSLDGILTTVRNQIRVAPLDTNEITVAGHTIRVPTRAEILRVKAWLIVRRNATRDYLDVAAIAAKLTDTVDLTEYKALIPEWRDWATVVEQCSRVGTLMANAVATQRSGWKDVKG